MKQIIKTEKAPAAIGPYNQAVKVGNMLFLSGQIPLIPLQGVLVEGDITAQTEQVMANIGEVLMAAGANYENVVKTTCFLSDLGNFKSFNEVYAKYFTTNAPARSTVEVSKLPMGALVEVECVAIV